MASSSSSSAPLQAVADTAKHVCGGVSQAVLVTLDSQSNSGGHFKVLHGDSSLPWLPAAVQWVHNESAVPAVSMLPPLSGRPAFCAAATSPVPNCAGKRVCLFVTDPQIEPALSECNQQTLQHLAGTVASILATAAETTTARAAPNNKDPERLIAYAAHDILTPLTGVQLSLALLLEEEQQQQSTAQRELLVTAAHCADLMVRICQESLQSLRNQPVPTSHTNSSPTRITALVSSLQLIVKPFFRHVPVVWTVESSSDLELPAQLQTDETAVYRATLALVTAALRRTTTGRVHVKFSSCCQAEQDDDRQFLVVAVEDTAPDIPVDMYKYLYTTDRPKSEPDSDNDNDDSEQLFLALAAVDSIVKSIPAGEHGFRPRSRRIYHGDDHDDHNALDDSQHDDDDGPGSVFSFRVPFTPVASADNEPPQQLGLRASGSSSILLNSSGSASSLLRPSLSNCSIGATTGTAAWGYKNKANSNSHHRLYHSHSQSILRRPQSQQQFHNSAQDLRLSSSFAARPACLQNATFTLDATTTAAVSQKRQLSGGSRWTNAVLSSSSSSSTTRTMPSTTSGAVVASGAALALYRERKALVIEDSTVVRKGLARALSKLDFVVTQATNGLEGLERMKETMFDIILCDFLMPVMDGLDCVQQYRAWEARERPQHRQPIIGISAHVSVSDSGQGLQAGMDDFLPKPISIQTLTELQSHVAVTASSAMLDEWHHSSTKIASNSSIASRPRSSACTTAVSPPPPFVVEETTHHHKEQAEQSNKRAKRSSTATQQPPRAGIERVCLLTGDMAGDIDIVAAMESTGLWKTVRVKDGPHALRLLKMRNWDAVLIDGNLAGEWSAMKCMGDFREWEAKNRVNEQRNVFLVCHCKHIPGPFEALSVVQAPSGFNGVARAPLLWKELDVMIQKRNLKIVVRR